MKKLKKIPDFKNDAEEAEFWDTHDSGEYIDWSNAEERDLQEVSTETQTSTAARSLHPHSVDRL